MNFFFSVIEWNKISNYSDRYQHNIVLCENKGNSERIDTTSKVI